MDDMNWHEAVNERGEKVIVNPHGKELDLGAAISNMDDELQEELHLLLAPCSEALFFAVYAVVHRNCFGEKWELAKPNPVW